MVCYVGCSWEMVYVCAPQERLLVSDVALGLCFSIYSLPSCLSQSTFALLLMLVFLHLETELIDLVKIYPLLARPAPLNVKLF